MSSSGPGGPPHGPPYRKGKWTDEENVYVEKLVVRRAHPTARSAPALRPGSAAFPAVAAAPRASAAARASRQARLTRRPTPRAPRRSNTSAAACCAGALRRG